MRLFGGSVSLYRREKTGVGRCVPRKDRFRIVIGRIGGWKVVSNLYKESAIL